MTAEDRSGDQQAESAPGHRAAAGPAPGRGADWIGFGRAQWIDVLAGLFAGLIAFGFGEAVYEIIPAANATHTMGGSRVMMPNRDTRILADARNGAVTFGVLGLCLGGCLGLAGGLVGRSPARMAIGGLLGAVLGAGLGVGLSLALLGPALRMRDVYFDYDLLISVAMHGLIWGSLGAAAGLAFAAGMGDWRRAGRYVIGGLVGAILGTLIYEAIGAAIFSSANTGEVISTTMETRFMARLLVTAGTALMVALLLPGPPAAAGASPGGTVTPTTAR
jgi:hypothetical protein